MTTDRRAAAAEPRATTAHPRHGPQTKNRALGRPITPHVLIRLAGVAAVTAGLLFIGVQVNHPHLDATTITTTDVAIRNALKVLMVGLTLVGITGMYLRQVKETGLLGFVDDALAVATGRTPDGDIGLWATVMQLQGVGYLAGALLFGIALYRARVLVRWATALLAVSGLATAALSVMPDALYRFLAWPNGIAMVALGYSLWQSTRAKALAVDAASVHHVGDVRHLGPKEHRPWT